MHRIESARSITPASFPVRLSAVASGGAGSSVHSRDEADELDEDVEDDEDDEDHEAEEDEDDDDLDDDDLDDDDGDDDADDSVTMDNAAASNQPNAVLGVTDLLRSHGSFFPEWNELPQVSSLLTGVDPSSPACSRYPHSLVCCIAGAARLFSTGTFALLGHCRPSNMAHPIW